MSAFKAMAAVAAVLAGCADASLRAADPPYIPPPGAPAYNPTIAGQSIPMAGTCPTCGGAATSGKTCQTCGSSWFHKHEKGPYVVNLCPGACFGYFQTQWRKWDEVCPYPYQGIGVSDAPRPPVPPTAIPKAGTPQPGPQPVVPKTSDSKPNMPTIPMPPGY